MKKSTEAILRWIFLFLSFDKPDAGADSNCGKQDDFPGKSACYEYGCRAIGTADDTNTHCFIHTLRWDPS